MVELDERLDGVFRSLGDSTRRDILRRISRESLSVGEIARHYRLTFAAVAKHLEVLEKAGLVRKTRRGKQQFVSISLRSLAAASHYLENYQQLWESRLDSLEKYLKAINKPAGGKLPSGKKRRNTWRQSKR